MKSTSPIAEMHVDYCGLLSMRLAAESSAMVPGSSKGLRHHLVSFHVFLRPSLRPGYSFGTLAVGLVLVELKVHAHNIYRVYLLAFFVLSSAHLEESQAILHATIHNHNKISYGSHQGKKPGSGSPGDLPIQHTQSYLHNVCWRYV